MNGTEKQVKWAEEIKANMVKALNGFLEANKEVEGEELAQVKKISDEVNNNDSAAWFINNKGLVEKDDNGNMFFDYTTLTGVRNRTTRKMDMNYVSFLGR